MRLDSRMSFMPLNLVDLVPRETTFTLSSHGEKLFTICKWSLRVRAWAMQTYKSEGLKDIFEQLKISEIADITWFMLKDKEFFDNNKDTFLDNVSSVPDQVNVIKALLGAVGIGEPEIKKISASLDEKKSPTNRSQASPPPKSKKKIGAKSSTP